MANKVGGWPEDEEDAQGEEGLRDVGWLSPDAGDVRERLRVIQE